MHSKKLIFLLPLICASLTGCGNEPETFLLKNFNYFEESTFTDDKIYIDGNLDNVKRLISSRLPFVVYLTEDGCGACNDFSSIMETWTKSSEALVVKITDDVAPSINKELKNLFATYADGEKTALQYPTVGVVKSQTKFEVVQYDRYMQTETAFNKYMNETYKTSNIYFYNEEIETEKDYIKVSYNFDNAASENVYATKVLNYILKSEKHIIVSNSCELENKVLIEVQETIDNVTTNYSEEITENTNDTNIKSLLL